MPLGKLARVLRTTGLIASLLAFAAAAGEAAPGGTKITNTATVTYADDQGRTFTAQSNAVFVSVASVSAITVTPKEPAPDVSTEGYTAGTPLTRTFTITNGGNVADAYTVAAAASGAGTLVSIAFVTSAGNVPITLNSTVSPTLQPGESIKVQLVITTAGIAAGTTFPITLTARSTNVSAANGLVSDSGRQWAIAQPGASIAGPLGPTSIVTKLVNQVRTHPAQPGETVTYAISFKNYGGSPATNVVLTDRVPAGITVLPNTLALNGTNIASAASLNGQVLTVNVGTLAVGATDTLSFEATVQSGSVTGASFVNVAQVQADGIAPVATSPASVLIGLANVVYDGFAGGNSPVSGAVLTLRDFATKAIVGLPKTGSSTSSSARAPLEQLIGVPPDGLAPNRSNANPFVTGSDGAYSLVFSAAQLGTQSAPAVYELDISAPGYRDRRIQVTISPDASGLLYSAVLRELDDQMLAAPGGFTLVANSVSLPEVFGLLGNLPMFAAHPLAVSKTVDRDVASGGDRLLYTIQAGASCSSLGATKV
ncbi:MAG TPA: isopeptide-forming domain-containing fimbrial protein, partial [Candidatus Limnocylindrales bacterium]|nr:isopeptide-forming domain-containing fimbrial protein [Candidatus Limnocylindrales bacterium]